MKSAVIISFVVIFLIGCSQLPDKSFVYSYFDYFSVWDLVVISIGAILVSIVIGGLYYDHKSTESNNELHVDDVWNKSLGTFRHPVKCKSWKEAGILSKKYDLTLWFSVDGIKRKYLRIKEL